MPLQWQRANGIEQMAKSIEQRIKSKDINPMLYAFCSNRVASKVLKAVYTFLQNSIGNLAMNYGLELYSLNTITYRT